MILVRFLRAAPHLCSLGIDPGFPKDLLTKEDIESEALLGPWPNRITNVIREMTLYARGHLSNLLQEKRIRECFLEAISGCNFLRKLEANGFRLDKITTHSSPTTLWSMWRGCHFGYKLHHHK